MNDEFILASVVGVWLLSVLIILAARFIGAM